MHFDLHEKFFEREVGIRSIGDLQFSGCRIFVRKVDLCRVLSSSVLVSSVQLPTSMSNTGGTRDNAKKDISTSEHMVQTLRANMLMTLFLPHAHFLSFVTCCCAEWMSELFFATDDTATLHESYTKKTADFRSPTKLHHFTETPCKFFPKNARKELGKCTWTLQCRENRGRPEGVHP